jgi:hypothetical protein
MAANFARVLQPRRPGHRQKGSDVRAVQRTLRQLGLRKARPTGRYGRGTVKQVKEFQRKHGLRADGVYGFNTHGRLHRHFDATAKREYQSFTVIHVALWAAARNGSMHYVQMRPMDDMAPPPNINSQLDCSEFLTWCFKAAGLRDPSDLGYAGWGNTATQVIHGRSVADIRQARPGLSAVFYGMNSAGDPTHVAVYIGKRKRFGVLSRHVVVSMGSEPGPLVLPYDYRHDRHSIRVYA